VFGFKVLYYKYVVSETELLWVECEGFRRVQEIFAQGNGTFRESDVI
jgi:hypothetical protein